MTETQKELERLRTLQEGLHVVADAVEVQLPALADKIDNIQLPEIDTTELAKEATLNEVSSKLDNLNVEVDLSSVAKQGENQDATNTAIYALLSQFGESVLQEKVTVILNCQENIVWSDYKVEVTIDSSTQYISITENGTCSFSIKRGKEYSVQLPIIGGYVLPQIITYTAISPEREIYWSYVESGIVGMDELGRKYSISAIEKLSDKSIIKYGVFTDEYLENSIRKDGNKGNGFIWKLGEDGYISKMWSSKKVEFSQELLPFLDRTSGMSYCDGKTYTQYIINEGLRLSVETPAASHCVNETISINGVIKRGYIPAYGQISRLLTDNNTTFLALYTACGLTPPPNSLSNEWFSSCQYSKDYVLMSRGGDNHKTHAYRTLIVYDLTHND